ncbi:unnamed protein product [Candidula unifasciata]|uniref:Uncharacterized protein n=1 Tax=Candidula unifasciata TaxID=100452 RepID=A0A8S3ZXF4_9EUPU|nr:unnamed protein product [Candidula unifasciata]
MFNKSIQQKGWLVIPLLYCIVLLHTCTGEYPQLDKFLGRWLEVRKEGFEKVANDLGLTDRSRALYENGKSVVVYSRRGDLWTVQVGIEGAPHLQSYTFKFGEPYYSNNIDGTPLKSVVLPEGDRLVARYESLSGPYYVMDVVWEVEDDTMRSYTTVNGETVESIFKRDGIRMN